METCDLHFPNERRGGEWATGESWTVFENVGLGQRRTQFFTLEGGGKPKGERLWEEKKVKKSLSQSRDGVRDCYARKAEEKPW